MQVFIPLLTTLFIYLKLVGSIAWSWWWVLSPLWIAFLVAFTLSLIFYLLAKKYY